MTIDSLKTLFHPFDTGALQPPGSGTRALFIGAEPGFRLSDGFAADFTLVQGFRPQFLALQKAGHRVLPTAEGDGYDLVLVLAGRHRGQNELRIADALERVRPGGLILVAGGKEDGIGPLRRSVEGLMPVEDHLAKYHGAVFWLRLPAGGVRSRSQDIPAVAAGAAATLRAAYPPILIESRYETRPGMFSHGRVDPGSRLLVENLPVRLTGAVADFCAGWGFVAAEVASRFASVSRLDLYEGDHDSLEAARRNVARALGSIPQADERAGAGAAEAAGAQIQPVQIDYIWRDLLTEPVERRYDAVLMNPPFHSGRSAQPGIGQGMIAAAAKALKPGGRLLMVANRNLPYEPVLAQNFADSGEVARDDAFKVLYARR